MEQKVAPLNPTKIAPEDKSVALEQDLIGYALAETTYADRLVSEIAIGDFYEPLHRRVVEIIQSLRADDRAPSVEVVSDAIGDEEILAGVTVSAYLHGVLDGAYGATQSFDALADGLRDNARRRIMSAIGTRLATASIAGRSMTSELAQTAAAQLDDVLASCRVGKARSIDANTAIENAFTHMRSDAPSWPTTGLSDLDFLVGGFPRGQLSIMAGRPGMGKSAAALNSVRRAAQAGFPTAFFSLEMTDEQIGSRLVTDLAFTRDNPISYQDILQRRIDDDHIIRRLETARKQVAELPLSIEQQRGMSLSDISSRTRKIANDLDRKKKRLELVVVDHIGLVKPSQRYAGNRVREVAEISDGLAQLADELDCAMLGLCQLNRNVERKDNRRPDLSDLRDSGAIEEDASLVIFLYRPEYYLSKPEDDPTLEDSRLIQLEAKKNKLEFIVAKNRNGATGLVEAYCNIGANAIRGISFRGTP